MKTFPFTYLVHNHYTAFSRVFNQTEKAQLYTKLGVSCFRKRNFISRPALCSIFKAASIRTVVGCKQPGAHHVPRAMTAPRDRRADDNVELLPLKSMLVNNNYREDEAYYPPAPVFNNNPSSSNLYDYTLLSKRTPASKRYVGFQSMFCKRYIFRFYIN